MSRVVFQNEAAECGAACLAMVATHFGYKVDLLHLRSLLGVGSRGMSAKDLIEGASTLKLAGRGLRVEMEELRSLAFPAILHWQMSHYIVLDSVDSRGRFHVRDPAVGARVLDQKQMSDGFTGIALEFGPLPEFVKDDKRTRVSLLSLWKGNESVAGPVAKIMALSALAEVIGLFVPLLLQILADEIIPAMDVSFIVVVAIAASVMLIAQAVGVSLRFRLVELMRTSLNLKMSGALFGHMLSLPISYFQVRHYGDLQSRFHSLDTIHSGLSGPLITTVFDAFASIFIFSLMLFYNPGLAFFALACACMYMVVRWHMHPPTIAAHEEMLIASAKRDSFLLESLRGIETLKVYASLATRSGQYQNLSADYATGQLRVAHYTNLYQFLSTIVLIVSSIGTICIGSWLVIRGDLTLGMLFAFILYRSTFTTRLVAVFDAVMQTRMLALHASRVSDISLQDRVIEPSLPGKSSGLHDVVVRDLSFTYPGDRAPIFDKLSFSLSPGTTLGIVGPSGCGKTTLGKILAGLLLPSLGRVTVSGEELRGEDGARRHSIAVVSQSDVLFSDTILQNIVLWEPDVDIDRVRMACVDACIMEDIDALPLGLNSPVGEGGGLLSGGQRQRIYLARALYAKPEILILDEATSNLDVETERRVIDRLCELPMIRIQIAHRPHAIARCDLILDLGIGGSLRPSINTKREFAMSNEA